MAIFGCFRFSACACEKEYAVSSILYCENVRGTAVGLVHNAISVIPLQGGPENEGVHNGVFHT